MKLPIVFQSLDRIVGKEGRSKLLHVDSSLYRQLQKVKQAIANQFAVGNDRMGLHIEVTKMRHDPLFKEKTASLQDKEVDLSQPDNWEYLGRAFVLRTPEVADYGPTHITINFFGQHPRPDVEELRRIIWEVLACNE